MTALGSPSFGSLVNVQRIWITGQCGGACVSELWFVAGIGRDVTGEQLVAAAELAAEKARK